MKPEILKRWNIADKKLPAIGTDVLVFSKAIIDTEESTIESEFSIRKGYYLGDSLWISRVVMLDFTLKGKKEKLVPQDLIVSKWHPFNGKDLQWWEEVIFRVSQFYWSNKNHVFQICTIALEEFS